MKQPVVVIGMGEMGGVFARGLLRAGHPVYPLRRGEQATELARALPHPEATVVAVGENDLSEVLRTLPESWQETMVLLQNELLPADFASFPQTTVIAVWFEKKPGQDYKIIQPSPVYGPKSSLLEQALGTLGIPTKPLDDAQALLFELVLKNLYILTTNIAGLKTGGNVGALWEHHQALTRAVLKDVIHLQETLTGHAFDHQALLDGLLQAFAGDPSHQCRGRSAPARLARALQQAQAHGIALPTLERIAMEIS